MQSPCDRSKSDVVIIGAGIVGLACAEHLIYSGRKVLLIEKNAPAKAASYGNAGAFAFSDILPLASPGLIKKAIKWLIDPLGPFSVVPKDLPWTLLWLIRFLIASRPAQFRRSIDAQVSLMDLSKSAMGNMVARNKMNAMVHSQGALHLFENDREFKADRVNWACRQENGIEFESFHGGALHEFQPYLSSQFVSGIFVPGWQTVSNPYEFAIGLLNTITKKGADILTGDVISLSPKSDGVELRLKDGRIIDAKQVVIAAGPWSASLAKQLGDNIPLVAERGYNTTLPKPSINLQRQLIFGGHGFVMTPLNGEIRVGGASEISRLGGAENYKRSAMMLDKAAKFIPNLDVRNGVQWSGARPSIPDTLPVIGKSSQSSKVVYAFGHGHLGLTQSASTGLLVTAMINNQSAPIEMAAYRPTRF